MRSLFLVSVFLFGFQAFSFENVEEFSERFREKKCETSRQKAVERVAQQSESGSDTYDGSVTYFRGKKIVRFIQTVERCEAVYSDTQGMLFDYYLRVQVAAK